MNIIIISIFILFLLLILYKMTDFFHKKWHKIFHYLLVVFLFSLALINITIGNQIFNNFGFSLEVTLNYLMAVLLAFSGTKVIS